ncbi:DNA polymerase III subunit delta' [Actibacterium pelagium]|uniref:DNA polymerase III subunit delta n=1 Tax=Actibacterium pelagium TaxID=2029103 RepID=A0A917AJR1_9RHOB|nr:DNA polymerase III subunit delta' [Actibacterium pelagium]GGE57795.1 DNA polymerase III subunit delta' [Actibacterium pelagium]
MSDRPEPDAIDGAPHPRETEVLYGQHSAEEAFLTAFNSGRLHHGWLITGPRGVGKATLAWKLARFLLATPKEDGGFFTAPTPETLDIPVDHPVSHRLLALSEPGLFLLRRAYDDKKDALKTVITVDEVRKLKNFFSLSSTDGGRRVVIVDCADEMNVNAANALLKLLEEPPEDAVILLIAHQPSRLLPTIRSRCRELRCQPLVPEDMALALAQAEAETDNPTGLAALSGGSVGEAVRLTNLGGLDLYSDLVRLFGTLPRLDRQIALKLANSAVGKANAPKYDLLLTLIDTFLSRLARTGVAGPPAPEAAPGEAEVMTRLCPDTYAARTWAELAQELTDRMQHGRAVNLDPSSLILDTVLKIDQTAAKIAARVQA